MEIVLAARQHLEEAGPVVDEAGRIIVAASYRPVITGREIQLRKRRTRYGPGSTATRPSCMPCSTDPDCPG
ncbi:hypothetical protein H340_30121 [Streptomyces mobaraensis NBRC 13819 = DSM 40847]|uniref:Uncharacterized protein n=1 Tax=Streptomyces mobaraensis (strain ATCC 29032 / DSM 40847 / JCM 4168 / NBRC 13819 / NCIMB 11159 / IPCR 16-22) TaxID=1223523 RepID=M3BYH4_STRM1|nr:hypothetical protein H340_30121 [Streptomyces mobaraensis NBRC 13819 = DSM 40847]